MTTPTPFGRLDSVAAPIVVCAHSYGGAVITEACAGTHPCVRHLVYLTAFMPDDGETLPFLLARRGGPDDGIDFHDDGTFGFNVEAMMRQKLPLGWTEPEARALAVRHQRPTTAIMSSGSNPRRVTSCPAPSSLRVTHQGRTVKRHV